MTFNTVIIITFSILVLIVFFRYLKKGKLFFTSHYTFEKEYSIDKVSLQHNIQKTLENTKWKKINSSSNLYSAVTLPSMSSFSEKIKIEIKELNEYRYIVRFSSECILPTQIFDWGKNERNCNLFFNNLNSLLLK